jgi:hypothetical protein
VPPLCDPTGIASSSEEVNSITLLRFGGGDARFVKPLPLEACAILLSSLALDLCSPVGRLCWRSAATSTSTSGVVVGDVALRFPARSLGLTIFGGGTKHAAPEQTPEDNDVRTEGILKARAAEPMPARLPIATLGPQDRVGPIGGCRHVSLRLHGQAASAVRRVADFESAETKFGHLRGGTAE